MQWFAWPYQPRYDAAASDEAILLGCAGLCSFQLPTDSVRMAVAGACGATMAYESALTATTPKLLGASHRSAHSEIQEDTDS